MKTRRPLWRISIATTLEAEDAVSELLGGRLNGRAWTYFDVEQQTSVVSIFSTRNIQPKIRSHLLAGLKRIKTCGLNTGAGTVSIGKVRARDWAESWKRHFKPITIGGALLIKPSWVKKKARRGQA